MNRFFNKVNHLFSKNWEPQFLILGVQKAGTTTLYNTLNNDTKFCGSLEKETGFFAKDVFYNQGKEWYSRQFERCCKGTLKFEATPEYLYYPEVVQRIFSFNQNMKFIVVLRDPVARCYSAWNMFRRFNQSSADQIFEQFTQYANPYNRQAISKLLFTDTFPTFSSAVQDDIDRYMSKDTHLEPSFVRRGIYFDQIEKYLMYFSLDNFLFLEQSELASLHILSAKISNFLNINFSLEENNAILSNVGDYPQYTLEVQETIKLLKVFYKPHNEALFNLIGIRYDWD